MLEYFVYYDIDVLFGGLYSLSAVCAKNPEEFLGIFRASILLK
jgi:hypothetical protein